MKFKIELDTADLCILLVNIMSGARRPVTYRLGKILIADLTERFEDASNFSQLEHEIDLSVFDPDELPYVIVQLELISERTSSAALKDFIDIIISELRAEQLRR